MAATLVAGGLAVAAIPGEDGSITACYTDSAFLFSPEGSLRVVDSPSQCGRNETALTWNQVGQPGPQGPTGPQGPEGPQGPPGELEDAAGGDLTGFYPNPQIATGAIGAEHFGNEVIRGGLAGPIADESITSFDIANRSVRADDIASLPFNSVGDRHIVDGTISERELRAPAEWQDIDWRRRQWGVREGDQRPQCYRDELGIVHLRGILYSIEKELERSVIADIPCGGPTRRMYFQVTRLAYWEDPPGSWSHTLAVEAGGQVTDWIPAVPLFDQIVLDAISYPTH